MSSIYLPTARIAGVGYGGAVVARGRRRPARPRSSATLLPAIEATRVDAVSRDAAGLDRGRRAAAPLAARAGAAAALARRPRCSRAPGPSTAFRSSGSRRSRSSSLALALAAPLRVRLGAALPGRAARAALRRRGPPGRGLLRRRARAQRHRRHRARDGARDDARDDRDRGVDPRDRARLGRVDAALGPLDQGRRGRALRHRRRPAGRDPSRSSRRSTGVAAVDPFRARETTDARGRPFTLASGDFRVVARVGGLPLLDGKRPAAASRSRRGERGEVLVSEPFARRFGAARDGTVDGRDAAGPARASAWPASTATTPTTAAPSSWTASSTSRSSATRGSRASPSSPRRASDADDLRRRILAAARGRYALSISTNRELRREVARDLRPDLRRDAGARGDRRRASPSSGSPTRCSPRPSSGGAPSACCARSGPRARRSGGRRCSRRCSPG